jgi:hypothetical protein
MDEYLRSVGKAQGLEQFHLTLNALQKVMARQYLPAGCRQPARHADVHEISP